MNKRVIKRLHDAFDACNELQRIRESHTREGFMVDYIVQLAVWKLIEIVGESLRQAEIIAPDIEGVIPDVRQIINTRDRIVHGYDSVSFNLLWDIVMHRIDPLTETLEAILDAERS